MIINSKYYSNHSYLMGGIIALRFIFKKIFRLYYFRMQRPQSKSEYSTNIYFPVLEKIDENAVKCTSCGICEKVCPTKCIEISQNNDIRINSSSVMVGPPPKNFKIKLKECLQCRLCEEVCPVDAISLTGKYNLLKEGKEVWELKELKEQSRPPKQEF